MSYLTHRILIAQENIIRLISGLEVITLNIQFNECRVFKDVICVIYHDDYNIIITGYDISNNTFRMIYNLKYDSNDDNLYIDNFRTVFKIEDEYIYHYIHPLTGNISIWDISSYVNANTKINHLLTETNLIILIYNNRKSREFIIVDPENDSITTVTLPEIYWSPQVLNDIVRNNQDKKFEFARFEYSRFYILEDWNITGYVDDLKLGDGIMENLFHLLLQIRTYYFFQMLLLQMTGPCSCMLIIKIQKDMPVLMELTLLMQKTYLIIFLMVTLYYLES